MRATLRESDLEIEGTINDNKYHFLIDTRSEYSYIDEAIAIQNNLQVYDIPSCTAVLIDGSEIQTSRETIIQLSLQGYKMTTYRTKARVHKNMSLTDILGMDSILCNDAKIDLTNRIITLDKKHYEIFASKKTTDIDRKIMSKTSINAERSGQVLDDAKKMIKISKLKNMEIGEMKGTNYSINLTIQSIITNPSFRIFSKMMQLSDKEIDYLLQNKII